MSNRRFVLLTAALALLISSPAFAAEKGKAPAKTSGGKAILTPAADLKWVTPPNSPPGVQMAVLWGDPAKGPHGALHKFSPGFVAPLHHHSAGYHGVVISGTMSMTPEGEAEKTLGPGSFFQITGKKRHVTKCLAGAECVIEVDSGGAWDVVMADASKTAPKK